MCRLGPTESEVYNLGNEGEEISRFRAQFTADLTTQLQPEKEKENKDSNAEGAVSLQTKTSSMRVLLALSKAQMVRSYWIPSQTQKRDENTHI